MIRVYDISGGEEEEVGSWDGGIVDDEYGMLERADPEDAEELMDAFDGPAVVAVREGGATQKLDTGVSLRHVEGKYWRYVDSPDDAPDWADLEEAPKGGQYRYDTENRPTGSGDDSSESGGGGSDRPDGDSDGETPTPDGSITAGEIERGDEAVIDGEDAEVTTKKDMGGGWFIAGETPDGDKVTARVGPDAEFESAADDGGTGYEVSDDGFDRELAEAVESGEMLGTDAVYRNMGKVDDPELVADALETELEGADRKTSRERLESRLRVLEGEEAVREVRERVDGESGGPDVDVEPGDEVSIPTGAGREDIEVASVDPSKCGPGMTELEDVNGRAYCVEGDEIGEPVEDGDDGDLVTGFDDIEEGDEVYVHSEKYSGDDSLKQVTVSEKRTGGPNDVIYTEEGPLFTDDDIIYDDPTSDAAAEDASAMAALEEGDVVDTADGGSIEVAMVAEADGDTVVYGESDSLAYRIDDLSDDLTDRSDDAAGAFDRVSGYGFGYSEDETVEENLRRLEKRDGGVEKREKVMRRLPEDEVPEDYEPPEGVELAEFNDMKRSTEDKVKRVLQDEMEDRAKVGGVYRETMQGLEIRNQVSRANSRKGRVQISDNEKRSTIHHEMGHQVFQAHGIDTGYGGKGADKASNYSHRPPEWPSSHNEDRDKFEPSDNAPDELNELAEEVNGSFQTMVDEIRDIGRGGKVSPEDEHELNTVFYDYAACNAHETLAMTHEIMQTGGQRAGRSALKTLEREHPDTLEAYSRVFEVPEETRRKMDDAGILAGDGGVDGLVDRQAEEGERVILGDGREARVAEVTENYHGDLEYVTEEGEEWPAYDVDGVIEGDGGSSNSKARDKL